jgi:hypothetical protein
MTHTVEKWGLLHLKTNTLLGVSASSDGDGEFCGNTQYVLSVDEHGDDPTWLVDSEEVAKLAMETDTPWYNAGYNSPSHSYLGGCGANGFHRDERIKGLEVVKVTLNFDSGPKKKADK